MHVVLFDIDGTLIDTHGAGRAALHDALELAFDIDTPHQVDLSGRTDRGITRELFEAHAIPLTTENWERFRDVYLDRLAHHLPRREGKVLPGVRQLVAALQQRGIPLGLLTGNVREGARRKLSYFDLFSPFEFGGFGDMWHDRGDVACEALEACRRHVDRQIEPQRIWVIGDTPHDVSCARVIGARTLAVATGAFTAAQLEECQADLVLSELSDTARLLERLLA